MIEGEKKSIQGEYRGPGPRPGSGLHRYIYLIYQSNERIEEKKTFENIEQRRKFPLKDFVVQHHLQLIYQNHFLIDA